MPSDEILFLLQQTQWNNWWKLCPCQCPTAGWLGPDLSSLQVCLCRTPLNCEQGQNQKATSSSPSQHVQSSASLLSLPQETEQSIPAVCSAIGVIRTSRTRPCHAVFQAG